MLGLVTSGFAFGFFSKFARSLSKSAAQFPSDDVRKELKKSFLKALVNCDGVGLSLFPPCCLIVLKKFSIGSVLSPLVKRNLKSLVFLGVPISEVLH